MLTITSIRNGIVIDHIRAGLGIRIFYQLGLDKADTSVALIMNAVHFVPQSRPRLFIVAALKSAVPLPPALRADGPNDEWHPPALVEAYGKLSKRSQSAWTWWHLAEPPARASIFASRSSFSEIRNAFTSSGWMVWMRHGIGAIPRLTPSTITRSNLADTRPIMLVTLIAGA